MNPLPYDVPRAELVGFVFGPLAVMGLHISPVAMGVAFILAFPVTMISREMRGARSRARGKM